MRLLNPETLPNSVGFSHVAVPGPGEPIYLAGQTGHQKDGSLPDGLVAQFAAACANVAAALAAAGAGPTDLVSLQIFVVDATEYRERRVELGRAYQSVFGRHYPPMALFGVTELFDPSALVELVGIGFKARES